MLTRRASLGAIDQSPALGTEFLGSRNNGGSSGRRIKRRGPVQASHVSGGGKSRASLAYVRSLSMKLGSSSANDSVSRSVADARIHTVIPYSDLVLRRQLDGGHSLIEATESGLGSEYCWEEAWKLYMGSQTATLKELAARMQECNPQNIDTTTSSCSAPAPLPKCFDSANHEVEEERGSGMDGAQESKEPSFLPSLRAEKLGRRRTSGLLLLNVLAALYGSTTVAGKFASDVAPGLPASLSSLVRFSSALLVFLPALRKVFQGQSQNPALLKAGAELGGLLFAASILETCGDGGASSDAPLLFAFTVIFVPIMELCAGRQSVRNITRIATLVALSGMGVLEEEGFGWKGISVPQVGDVWGLAASAVYALHIFRSEAHSRGFKAFELTAVQCGTVASLSLVWEISRVLHGSASVGEYASQLQALPWGPLVYTGLVSSGLCSWLEIHGLRSVHASTATMVNTTIPIWGAFLSFFLRGESLDDSAIAGGSVILAASLFAQLVSKQDAERHSSSQKLPPPGHVQGALITSQLKFPYYAAQAKRLLVETKFKLLSMKSLVMSTLLTNAPPSPPGSLHSAIATSVTLQQASSSPHSVLVLQWVESALAALGSDVAQAVEEAEDVAKLVELGTQSAVHHVAMAATSVESLLELLKSADATTGGALVDRSLECALPVIAHHADAVLPVVLSCTSMN